MICWFTCPLQLCFACLFTYFFITNFLALYRTQQFVSVDPESGICKQVSGQQQHLLPSVCMPGQYKCLAAAN